MQQSQAVANGRVTLTPPASPTAPTLQVSESGISGWCDSKGKRAFDICAASLMLMLALPLVVLIAVSVKLTSRGPALFRQRRVGQGGREFQLTKFRTMAQSGEHNGPRLTRSGDPRVTGLGRVLRRWKLDELPQLFNLLHGDMSLVGPRPDMAEFLGSLKGSARDVLLLKPGITGSATLQFRNEEELLASVPEEQLREVYIQQVLPQKVKLDLDYASTATFTTDLLIVMKTALAIFR